MTIIESHEPSGAVTIRPLRDNDRGATILSPRRGLYRVFAGYTRADIQVPVGGRLEIYSEADHAAF